MGLRGEHREPVPPGQDSLSYVMGVTYEWSAAGELMRRTVNGGSESRYGYDALGNLTCARARRSIAEPSGRPAGRGHIADAEWAIAGFQRFGSMCPGRSPSSWWADAK